MYRAIVVSLLLFTVLTAAIKVSSTDSRIEYFGRVDKSVESQVRFSWSGIHFRFRFTGTSLTLHFNDHPNRYAVFIDGEEYPIITTDTSNINYPVSSDLTEGTHEVLVHRRSENNWGTTIFTGISIADEGEILEPAPRPEKKIEIIGDSYTTGYGNEHDSRDGDQTAFLMTTNTMKAFSSLVGRHYNADYMVSGYSGLGLIRNAGNADPDRPHGAYYDLTLSSEINSSTPALWDYSQWCADLVIINLGINDFSGDTIQPANGILWKEAYHNLIDTLQDRYPDVKIIICATDVWPDNLLEPLAQEVAAKEKAESSDVYYYFYNVDATALHWHPSVSEHQTIADGLISLIDKEKLLGSNSTLINRDRLYNRKLSTLQSTSKGIALSVPSAGEYSFSLFSLRGQRVFHQTVQAEKNELFTIDNRNSTGMYVFQISGNGLKVSERLLIK